MRHAARGFDMGEPVRVTTFYMHPADGWRALPGYPPFAGTVVDRPVGRGEEKTGYTILPDAPQPPDSEYASAHPLQILDEPDWVSVGPGAGLFVCHVVELQQPV